MAADSEKLSKLEAKSERLQPYVEAYIREWGMDVFAVEQIRAAYLQRWDSSEARRQESESTAVSVSIQSCIGT